MSSKRKEYKVDARAKGFFFMLVEPNYKKRGGERVGGGRRKKEKKRGKEEGREELPYHGASHQWVTIIIEQSSSQAVKVSSRSVKH